MAPPQQQPASGKKQLPFKQRIGCPLLTIAAINFFLLLLLSVGSLFFVGIRGEERCFRPLATILRIIGFSGLVTIFIYFLYLHGDLFDRYPSLAQRLNIVHIVYIIFGILLAVFSFTNWAQCCRWPYDYSHPNCSPDLHKATVILTSIFVVVLFLGLVIVIWQQFQLSVESNGKLSRLCCRQRSVFSSSSNSSSSRSTTSSDRYLQVD